MSIPAMKEIRRIFHRAHISLLVRPWVGDVYSSVDFVDELLEFRESNNRLETSADVAARKTVDDSIDEPVFPPRRFLLRPFDDQF